ncbi:hypothetical protein L2E82_06131 [Cichorium intybus]|uniref:Uncharacterized protein n=1 Tax=Cichorium intybus TaxID=13427 RepID=A0ACB9HAB0_CICIN|nr:hypothetical protein L2E82_06131 [Cichorium intybus]
MVTSGKGEIGGKESEKWHSYPSVGRTGSTIPTASEVSIYEFRSAATGSDHYPGSLHAPFMSSPDSPPYIPERFIDDNLRKESFHESRQDINAAIDRICEFSGSKIIFWDLREPFIQNLTTKVCCEYVLALMIQFCDLFCRTQACRTGDQTRCSTQEGCINNKVGITETAIDDAILGAIIRIFDKHVVVGEPLQSKSSQHTPMNTPKSMRFDHGEASHLDLNEELVVEKAATSGATEENTLNSNADPQASFQATIGTAEDNTLNSDVDP